MRMSNIQVIKRNGQKEDIDLEKLHKVVFYACRDINGVSPSEVEIKSSLHFYNGITSDDIQETLIKSASELISEDAPNYQWVAGRLIVYHLRKQVYGSFDPMPLLDIVKKNVEEGWYDNELLSAYSEKEWEELNNYIKHDRDENFTYAAMEQWRGKYLTKPCNERNQRNATSSIYADCCHIV